MTSTSITSFALPSIANQDEQPKMTQSVSATIKGPDGPLNVVFGGVTPEQHPACCELIVAAFAPQFPASSMQAHENALAQHPLCVNQGSRLWCIYLADDPARIVTLCKTIRRRFLVRDSESMREEDGYCISMVATDSQYRRLGLGSLLMKQVAEWLDGPGGAAASMLYTSVGDFYVSMGWQIIPSVESNITHPSGSFPLEDRAGLPSTRLLTDEEIPALCARDVADLKDSFEKSEVGPDEVHFAVLPSADIVTYLHEWGDFLQTNLKEVVPPHVHGAICEAADTWIYWYHSFKHLGITRVRTPPGDGQGSPEVLAALLLDALKIAREGNHPKIVIWEPSPELVSALDLISKKVGVEVETQERSRSITSLRWKDSDQTKKTTLHLNETYAWA